MSHDHFWNIEFLFNFFPNAAEFDFVYDKLCDDESKSVLLRIIKHRLTDLIVQLKTSPAPERPTIFTQNLKLPSLKMVDGAYYDHWIICDKEMYIIPGVFEVKKDDIIIDGGAFIGDTAAYYSHFIGPKGKIFSFEPHPEVYETLVKNIQNNGYENVVCLNKALGKSAGTLLISDESEGGGTISAEGDFPVEVITIDSFMETSGIEMLNIIKLDIEGSEKDALIGASKSIRKYKPKLAVCAYHRKDDFYSLMKLILEIDGSYKFMMRHAHSKLYDTVLFAFV